MAIVTLITGANDIKDDFENLNTNDENINNQLEGHVAGTADKHNASDIVDDSGIAANQKLTNDKLQADRINGDDALDVRIDTEIADRIAGDDALASQIGAIVASGTVDPLTDVYKAKDLTNTNDYIATYGTIVPFDGMRLNLEIANSNTDIATLNLNSNGSKSICWLRNNVATEVSTSMLEGIVELQYSVVHDGYIAINVSGSGTETVATYENIINVPANAVKGQVSSELDGMTLVNIIELGDATTSVTSDNTNTQILLQANGTWIIGNYSAGYQTQNIETGNIYFALCKLKTDSVGRINKVGYRKSDDTSSWFGIGDDNRLESYAKFTATETETDVNFAVQEGTSGLVEREYQIFIDMTSLGIESLTESDMLNLINGYIDGVKSTVSGRFKSVGKNLFDGEFDRDAFFSGVTGLPSSLVGYSANSKDFPKIKNTVANVIVSNDVGVLNTFVFWYDSNGEYIDFTNVNSMDAIHTKPQGASIFNIGIQSVSESLVVWVSVDSTTTYESYQESIQNLNLPSPLKRVPNDAKDKVSRSADGGYKARYETKEYTLLSGDITSLDVSRVTVDFVLITKQADDSLIGNSVTSLETSKTKLLKDFIPGFAYTNGVPYTHINFSTTSFALGVPKGTYANLEEAQADLTGTELIYQLAEHYEVQLDTTPLIGFENGTVYYEPYLSEVFDTATTTITLPDTISSIDKAQELQNGFWIDIDATLDVDGVTVTVPNAGQYLIEGEITGGTTGYKSLEFPINLNAKVNGNTDAIQNLSSVLSDFIYKQTVTNLSFDVRITTLEP